MAQRQSEPIQYTWAASSNNSPSIESAGFVMFGLSTPATFTPTTIKFQASDGAGGFNDIYDRTGTLVTVPVSTSRYYDLPGELSAVQTWRMTQTVGGAPVGAQIVTIYKRS